MDIGEEINELTEIQPKVEPILETDSPSDFIERKTMESITQYQPRFKEEPDVCITKTAEQKILTYKDLLELDDELHENLSNSGLHSGYTSIIKIENEIEDETNGSTDTQPSLAHVTAEPDSTSVFKDTNTGASTSKKRITTKAKTISYRRKQNRTSQCHQVQNNYICDICNRSFKYKCILIRHIRTHTGEKPYACKMCDKKYKNNYSLKAHVNMHFDDKLYGCKMCDKKYIDKSRLYKHIRTHTGEKPYACKICEKKFCDPCNLRHHIKSHTGEKPFACNICEKKYSRKDRLGTHIRTHTGEKPYVCQICHKKYNHKESLDSHVRTHTGERPYVCHQCGRSFINRKIFNNHTKTHQKLFSCNICKKTFAQNRYLVAHMRHHTPTLLRKKTVKSSRTRPLTEASVPT